MQENISKLLIFLSIFSTLFLFTSLTTEFYETPKFFVLAVVVALLLLLWSLKSISQGKIKVTVTPLDLPLLLLLTVAIICTYLSPSPYVSLFGNAINVGDSLAAVVVLVLFYFLLTNTFRKISDIKIIIHILSAGGVILATASLLSFWGIKTLPFNFAQGLNFTPTGSSFSTTAILAMLLPITLLSTLKDPVIYNRYLSLGLSTLFGVTIVLTGAISTWAAALAAFILVLVTNNSLQIKRNLPLLAFPLLVSGVVAFLIYGPTIKQLPNPLYQQAQNFPREIQLSFPISWKISVSSFRDSPFIGTGPATFGFNFTSYKPLEFNQEKFWNVRFEQPSNEYLNTLSTLGGLGFLALLIFSLVFIKAASRSFTTDLSGLTISGLVFFILLALHSSSFVVWVIGLIIIASYMIINHNLIKQFELKLGSVKLSTNSFSLDALPLLLLLINLGLVGFSSFYLTHMALADFYHRQALNEISGGQGEKIFNALAEAEKFSPRNDLYRIDLAQTDYAVANALVAQKESGDLTDEDKKKIQQFLQLSISEAKAATVLSPRNSTNWEVLGSIYRKISGISQNAVQFSLDAYGRAIQRDPLNPSLRVVVGGIFYSQKNYDLAIRFFNDSINLKPDFINGYYNLSIALRDKGNLDEAESVAEKALALLKPKQADFKIVSDYLSDLKARITTGSASLSEITAPAAGEKSALEKAKLPKVIDLPKKEDIATPAAVKKQSSK